MHPRFFKFLLNIYPPYLGTGIVVRRVAKDFRAVDVDMKMRWYNRNYVRTHFGGSLYAMTDPFYMLMLMQNLGRDYVVWDQAAHIDFVRPGRDRVTARFRIEDGQLADILARTANGERYLPELTVDVENEAGEIVARVVKTLYVRRKPETERPRHHET